MARGEHIRVQRFLYSHHGIDCGDGTVLHYTGTLWKRKGATVKRTALQDFAAGKKLAVLHYDNQEEPNEVIQRAESRLNEQEYSLIGNNCEHFATWCMTGKAKSHQIKKVAVTIVTATIIVSASGIYAVKKHYNKGSA